MWYKPGGIFNVKIDIQRNIVEENYQTLDPNTVEVNGVKVLTPEYALALKVFCFHRRGEGYHYDLKRYSDRKDILFYCNRMRTAGNTISLQCGERFQIGAYRMAYLRMWLTDELFNHLLGVGIHRFLIPWNQDKNDQQEYYSIQVPGGTNPLTDSLPHDA